MKVRKQKTAAGKSAAEKSILACVKKAAKQIGRKPEHWVELAGNLIRQFDETNAVAEKWGEAIGDLFVYDGFASTENVPSIQVICLDGEGNLYHYDGEDKPKHVNAAEAVKILEKAYAAAEMFGLDFYNAGGDWEANGLWFKMLAKAMERNVTLSLSPKQWANVRACAKREGRTVDNLISECIDRSDAFNADK